MPASLVRWRPLSVYAQRNGFIMKNTEFTIFSTFLVTSNLFTFNCKQMALYDAVLFMVLFVFYSLSLGWDEITPKKSSRFSRISRAFISTTDCSNNRVLNIGIKVTLPNYSEIERHREGEGEGGGGNRDIAQEAQNCNSCYHRRRSSSPVYRFSNCAGTCRTWRRG